MAAPPRRVPHEPGRDRCRSKPAWTEASAVFGQDSGDHGLNNRRGEELKISRTLSLAEASTSRPDTHGASISIRGRRHATRAHDRPG